MAKSKLANANEKIAEDVTKSFQKMTEAVVGAYEIIENDALKGYIKIQDRFVDQFLAKEGESIDEAKQRLKREQEERRGQ